jgi:hypothetical protein
LEESLMGRRFPVLWQGLPPHIRALERLKCPRSVPWELLAPHEKQAIKNHSQDLETLASRGGLSPAEMVAILKDKNFGYVVGLGDKPDERMVPVLLQLIDASGLE